MWRRRTCIAAKKYTDTKIVKIRWIKVFHSSSRRTKKTHTHTRTYARENENVPQNSLERKKSGYIIWRTHKYIFTFLVLFKFPYFKGLSGNPLSYQWKAARPTETREPRVYYAQTCTRILGGPSRRHPEYVTGLGARTYGQ